MEYVEGTTLDQVGPLPLDPQRMADIAAQVCDALQAAHATASCTATSSR